MPETSGGPILNEGKPRQPPKGSDGSTWESVVAVSLDDLKTDQADQSDQAARHGPSMSVGTDEETWQVIKPYLEKWSAKAPNGDACMMRMGPGGAGHCESF